MLPITSNTNDNSVKERDVDNFTSPNRYLIWQNIVILLMVAGGYFLFNGLIASAPWILTFAVLILTSNLPKDKFRRRLTFALVTTCLSTVVHLTWFAIKPLSKIQIVRIKSKSILLIGDNPSIVVYSILCCIVFALLLNRASSFKGTACTPMNALKSIHSLEYAGQFCSLIGGAVLLLYNVYAIKWFSLIVLVPGSIILLSLKSLRANSLYMHAHWLHLFGLLITLTFWKFYLAINNANIDRGGSTASSFFAINGCPIVILLSCVLYAFSGVFVSNREGNSRTPYVVYLEQMVSIQTLNKWNQFSILQYLGQYDFVIRAGLMILWALMSPSFPSVLILLCALIGLFHNKTASWIWHYATPIAGLVLIADQWIDFHWRKSTDESWLISATLIRLGLFLGIYMIGELAAFLKSNLNFSSQNEGQPGEEEKNIAEQLPTTSHDYKYSSAIYHRRVIGTVVWWTLMVTTFVVCMIEVNAMHALLLFMVIWFVISYKASVQLFPMFIFLLVLIVTGQTMTSALYNLHMSLRPDVGHHLALWGFRLNARMPHAWRYVLLLTLALIYKVIFLSYSSPLTRVIPFKKLVHTLTLPVLICCMLVVALVQPNFGLVSLGYLLLFFWFSLRGMMIGIPRERKVFLKIAMYHSALCVIAMYGYQFEPFVHWISSNDKNVGLGQLMTDLGLQTFTSALQQTHSLACLLIVLLLARLQCFWQFESSIVPRSGDGDSMLLEEHKSKSLSGEVLRRALFLHGHKVLSLSLILAAANDFSLFSIVHFITSVAVMFSSAPPHLSRSGSTLLTLWLGLDILNKFVIHFQWIRQDAPFIVQMLLGFRMVKTVDANTSTMNVKVVELVIWQVLGLLINAFQPLIASWTFPELSEYGSVEEGKSRSIQQYLSIRLIPLANDKPYLEAITYYISHWFQECGPFVLGGLALWIGVSNRNYLGILYLMLAFGLSLPYISVRVVSGSILIQVLVMIVCLSLGYLKSLGIEPWSPLPESLQSFLMLPGPFQQRTFITLFICLALTSRLLIHLLHNPILQSGRRLTQAPQDFHDPLIRTKRLVITSNIWFAFALIFTAAVTQVTIPELPLIGLALAFARRGEMMYLQRINRHGLLRKSWDIVRITWVYILLVALSINILVFPMDVLLSKIVRHKELWKMLFGVVGLRPRDKEPSWQDMVTSLAYGLLLLHDTILRSPIMVALATQVRQERQSANRRANRYHLHRIESLRQQLDFDTAAAEETKCRIKERTGLSAKIDLSDWHKVFHGEPDFIRKKVDEQKTFLRVEEPDIPDSITKAEDTEEKENQPDDPYRISPHPVRFNLTKRKVEKFLEVQEQKTDFAEIKQSSLETGPEELFSPHPIHQHADVDESQFERRSFRIDLLYYMEWIYFVILRSILSWSEENRHICELKQTYQLVEQAKMNPSIRHRAYLLLIGFYYAAWSHFPFLVFIVALWNSVYYANLPSVIPTFLILLSGACQRPFTKPSFWKLLIRYTTIWILGLFVAQTEFFHMAPVPKTIFQFEWQIFLGITGYDSKLWSFVGPCILLFVLIMQRSMMRYLGTWGYWQPATDESHLSSMRRGTRASSVDLSNKKDFGFVDWLTGLADDFGGFLKSFGELPGKDFYTPMFCCDLICFIISCLQWDIFSGQELGESKDQLRFLNMVIRNNSVPAGFVLLAILQVVLMLVDRVIYCRKALKLKVLLQFFSLLVYHMWVVFMVPLNTQSQFRHSSSLVAWYVFKWFYWYCSALQVRQGYPLFRTTNFLFQSYNLINYYTFVVFRSVPLFLELRQIIDWTFTPSTLSIYQWFKFEQIRAILFGIKSNREYTDSRMGRRSLGMPKTQWWKHVVGGVMILGLCALVFFPLIWLSAPGSMLSNPVNKFQLSISYGAHGRLLDTYLFTDTPQNQVTSREVTTLRENKQIPSYFSSENLQKYETAKVVSQHPWMSTRTQELVQDLFDLPQDSTVTLWSEWVLTRGVKKSVDDSVENGDDDTPIDKPNRTHNQPERVVIGGLDVRVNATDLANLLNGTRDHLIISNLLPTIIEVPSTGQPTAVNYKRFPTDFTLRRVVDAQGLVWFEVDTPYTVYLHNHKVSGHRLSNYGVIGLYVTFVYAVARTLRNSLSNLPLRIPYEDLPNPDILLAICDDLLRVREFMDFRSEESLFYQLLEIYRRPWDLHELTSKAA